MATRPDLELMFNTIDRYILRNLITNFAIALCSMIAMYIVMDMFINIDEFTEHGHSLWVTLGDMFDYYWPNVFLYFEQLAGVITLFACMATLARLRMKNELTALLASGVSLYRVARPIIAFGLLTGLLLLADTEVAIPALAPKLSRDHDDVGGKTNYSVLFMRDRDNWMVSAKDFDPDTQQLQNLLAIQRGRGGEVIGSLKADLAEWEPNPKREQQSGASAHLAGQAEPLGRWKLYRGVLQRDRSSGEEMTGGEMEPIPARYYASDLTPDDIMVRQSESWIRFLSLVQLNSLRSRSGTEQATLVRTHHARIAKLIVSFIMLLLGLPFFLDRNRENIIGDATGCMIVTGLCYMSTFISQSVQPESASALPFWIPIFIFGILAIVLIDRVRT